MVDKKKEKGTTPTLSDETIDELGYARFTASDLHSTSYVDSSFVNTTPMVAGPTKSPPPVLMPRPRLAVHPTLKLTKAFANPTTDSSQVSQAPSQQAPSSPKPLLATLPEEEYEYPDQPPSTYITPPLAPLTMKPVTPTPNELLLSTQQPTRSIGDGSLKDPMVKETSLGGNQGSTISSSVSPSPVSSKEDSNPNQGMTEKGPLPPAQLTDVQSSSKEQGGAKQQTSIVAADINLDDIQSVPQDFLTRKPPLPQNPMATTISTSTSAPIVPSPLVKSTLASQLSTSSKSSSSSSSTERNISTPKVLPQATKSFSTPNQTNPQSLLDQLKQPQPQQRYTIRKAMSTEQLAKSNHYDPRPASSYISHSQHPSVEKLLYGNSNGGKTSIQQLQQEYLLRQNGYLRRQLEALRVDNMESQRQHQELVSRMKQLEIQLADKRQSAIPTAPGPPTLNEYQHHHHYHHNLFPTLDEDRDDDAEDSDEQQHERSMEDGQEASIEAHHPPQMKIPISQRRHSTHAASTTADPMSPSANRRQRHVTAPSLHHYGKPSQGLDRQQEHRNIRPRSRSVPKNDQRAFPPSQYRRPPQEQWMYHDEPNYIDDEEEDIDPMRYRHYRPRPPPAFTREFDEEDEDDEESSMEFNDARHFEDFYGSEEEEYLDDQEYYQHHMTAPGPPPPPMMYYPPPPFDRPPPPDAYFNDPYRPPLARRKSASGLRPTRGAPPGFMEIINQPHYDRPPVQPIRRNGPHATRPMPPPHRQRRMYPPEGPDQRPPPLHYGRQPRQPRPPPANYTIPPRSGFGEPHESSPRRKVAATASPRVSSTVPPVRRSSMARGSYPAGTGPRFNNRG